MFCIIAVQTLRAPQERYRIPEGVRREEKFQIELRRARHASTPNEQTKYSPTEE